MHLSLLKSVFVISFAMLATTFFSQKNKEIEIIIGWETPSVKKTSSDIDVSVPNAKNLSIENFTPKIFYRKKVNSVYYDLSLISYEVDDAHALEKKFLNTYCKEDFSDISISMKLTNSRNTSYAVFDFIPFVKKNNQIYRITSLKVELMEKPIRIQQKILFQILC